MSVDWGKIVGMAVGICASGMGLRAGAVVFSEAGPTGADLMDTVEAFRVALSNTGDVAVDNGLGGGPYTDGLRHVDWDLVPTEQATPNSMNGDFFNSTAPVGVNMTTLGSGFLVSAKPGEGPELRFGDINPQYTTIFQPFGGDRLFTPVLSTVTDVTFFLPGSPSSSAWVSGFGAIFLDVDNPGGLNATTIEFWDIDGKALGHWHVEAADNGVSFLGVKFDPNVHVGRVRITNGNIPPYPGLDDGLGGVVDIVAMGPFWFSEPMAIPEPGTLALSLTGLAVLLGAARGRCGTRFSPASD
jgi:hypothetical protein